MNLSLLRRHIFEPLFLKKVSSPKLSYWHSLEKTQYYSRQQLEDIQWQRLQSLWNFIWSSNTYYRHRFIEAGLSKKTLKEPADISRLPILTKKQIRDNTPAMLSAGFAKNKLHHFKTGGSTGKALDIYITEECSERRNACARRHDMWTSWKPGEPIGAIWGNPNLPKTWREKIINRLVQPYIYLDTMAVSSESVYEFANDWVKNRPTLLFGHAHSLFILAQQINQLKIKGIQPKGIISTSMMLLPHERKLIESTMGVQVTDRYGCEEVSLIGCECEQHNGMHMNIDHLIIEFIKEDGSPAELGESGNIVVTDLINFAMPFIRYSVEDVGTPLGRTCPCGRGLPLMGKVRGRIADFLIKPNGTKIAGISLIENTLTKISGIEQMQIIQEAIDDIVLKIVPGTNFREVQQKELVDYFKKLFDNKVNISVQLINEIRPEASGKFRFSICRVDH